MTDPIHDKCIALWRKYQAGEITAEEYKKQLRDIREGVREEVKPFDKDNPF